MNNSALVLSTVDEAVAVLQRLINESDYCPEEIKFEGNLTSLNITIKGNKYNGTFPATLAKQLWYLQEEFYRAVLFSLGRSENLNSLTPAEKEKYLITFQVSKGSTSVDGIISSIIEGLNAGFATMESKHKAITIITIALIFATGFYGAEAYTHKQDTDLDQIKEKIELEKEKEKTKQFEIIAQSASANKEAKRFSKAMDNSTQAILSAIPDAESVNIGYVRYDAEDIANASKRAPRSMSNSAIVTDDYFISTTDYRHSEMTKYTLRDSKGKEFSIEVNHLRFKDENIDKLQSAAKDRKKINLTLELTTLKDNIKLATLNKIN